MLQLEWLHLSKLPVSRQIKHSSSQIWRQEGGERDREGRRFLPLFPEGLGLSLTSPCSELELFSPMKPEQDGAPHRHSFRASHT